MPMHVIIVERYYEMRKDLTSGSIYKNLIMFSLPILMGYFFQNLYNSVDSAIVGQYVGKAALGAVTSSATISNVIVGFFTGLATGVTVILSRYFGAKDYEMLHKAIHTSILFSIVSGVAMALIGQFISPLLLKAVDCPADVYEQAIIYLRLYLIGCIFTSIYNVSSSVLRSVGDSRSPFIYLVISSVVNIVLDVVLVANFKMGVAGVGIATIVSQVVSCVCVYLKLSRTNDVHKLVIKDLSIDFKILKSLINIGLPAGLQTCLISLSNVFIQRYVNMFGSDAIAGVGAAQKVDNFASMPGQSLGLAITTFVSQNLGADKPERVKEGIKVSIVLVLVSLIPIVVFGMVFASSLVGIFNRDPDVVKYGSDMVRALLPLYFILGLNSVYSGVVRGYGHSRAVMILSLIAMVVLRQIYLAIGMQLVHSIYVVYYGYPVAWLLAAVAIYIFYKVVVLKTNKK